MRTIKHSDFIPIPDEVKVEIKSRVVTVTGPRGSLTKSFKHVDLEMRQIKISEGKLKGRQGIEVTLWNVGRKHAACLRTTLSHLANLMKGVTLGFRYKMRLVYAHFPINVIVGDDKRSVDIRNFLGEKVVRVVKMLDGVTIQLSTAQKDELILEGNSVENVSQSAAQIRQSVLVKNKDIRMFLDGIYVSEKGNIVQVE
jgi:large subunit ribosomal protein L9e